MKNTFALHIYLPVYENRQLFFGQNLVSLQFVLWTVSCLEWLLAFHYVLLLLTCIAFQFHLNEIDILLANLQLLIALQLSL